MNSTQLRAALETLTSQHAEISKQYSFMSAKVSDNDIVLNKIEALMNEFSLKNFKKSGKGPKKFIWWVILNADEVYTLITTIISLIKTLRKKYNTDSSSDNSELVISSGELA